MIPLTQSTAVLSRIEEALAVDKSRDDCISDALRVITGTFPHYNWLGVYYLDNGVLVLGPYIGAATEHTVISVGVGVCGTAVAENRNQIVTDVRTLENYLACSVETRSEIVVLIRDETGNILGQIDADGHTVGTFDSTDEAFLEQVARRFATHLLEKP